MENMIKGIFLFLLTVIFSCSSKENILIIENPARNKAITIITKRNKRYIINGKHKKVPNSNYAVLDISQVSPIGDEIGICWDIDGYKWRLVNAYSKFVKSKLDTSLYDLQKELIKDKHGAPTFKEYLNKSCVRISIREKKCLPENGAVLTYY